MAEKKLLLSCSVPSAACFGVSPPFSSSISFTISFGGYSRSPATPSGHRNIVLKGGQSSGANSVSQAHSSVASLDFPFCTFDETGITGFTQRDHRVPMSYSRVPNMTMMLDFSEDG
ncbi:hypothetical protein LINGRAHAP2_LOCUS22723 [Linum grandiflorum]